MTAVNSISAAEKISSLIWGRFTIILILICALYHTVKSGFIQLRLPFVLLKGNKGRSKDSAGRSRLKAVTSALAASMGTGNITGCAAAIAAGGAGAVFWMWVSAVLGMALSFSENRLGALYAERFPKSVKGPMLYMEKGLGSSKLAVIYAAGCLCTALCMGCMSQSWAFADALSAETGLSKAIAGVVIAAVTAAVIFSSGEASQGVMNITEKIVPIMGILYAGGCIFYLICEDCNIWTALGEICRCAFTPEAAAGGAAGITVKTAVSIGLRRGVFSNEAGMGSSVLVHGDAGFPSPDIAGAWAAFEVFLDTIVCCTLTALVIITSDLYKLGCCDLTLIFTDSLGFAGGAFVAVCVCLFAWAAILGWCCYGEKCLLYLIKNRHAGIKSKLSKFYRILFCAAALAGALITSQAVFGISDIFNAFVLLPNLLAITFLVMRQE